MSIDIVRIIMTYLERLFVGASCEKPLPFTLGWDSSVVVVPRPSKSAEPLLLLLLLFDVSKLIAGVLVLAGSSPSLVLLIVKKQK